MKIAETLDTLLDQTVLFSYTRLGHALRRLTWDEADLDVDLSGQVALVTGANAGLGLATSRRLAELGATVYMLARNPDKGHRALGQVVTQTGNQNVHLELADLSSLSDVRALAQRFTQKAGRLDVLIHNASVLPSQRTLSADGIETTFATNVLGPFLLTHLLLPTLKGSAPARIIWVSSGGMYAQKLDVDDLQFERGDFNGTLAYAQTKRAQVILSEMLAQRLAGSNVTVNAMHPGWVDTPGLESSLPTFHKLTRPFLRPPEQGADTIVWLAAAPHLEHESGKFWFDRRPRPTHKLDRTKITAQERQKLWAECVRLSGLEGEKPS